MLLFVYHFTPWAGHNVGVQNILLNKTIVPGFLFILETCFDEFIKAKGVLKGK